MAEQNQNIPLGAMAPMLEDNGCPICSGAGFVHPVIDGCVDWSRTIPCVCVREQNAQDRLRLLLESCKLPPLAEGMSFENFEQYAEVSMAFNEAKLMADKPGQLCWLALIGANGNGKTHLAVSICKAWLNAGIPARYTFVTLLLDELRAGFGKEPKEDSYEVKFNYYCNVPLLLLDDYGTESQTSWVQEKLDTLIDYRLMNNLSLIVTSNKSLEEMPNRIRSRLMRHPQGKIVAITAGDYALRGSN